MLCAMNTHPLLQPPDRSDPNRPPVPPPPDADGVRLLVVRQGEGRATRHELRLALAAKRASRQALALRLAEPHDGVVTRQMLVKAGLSPGEILGEVTRGAWRQIGCHTLLIADERTPRAQLWWALWESTRSSVLDGVTSLIAGGLQHWTEPVLHVSVPNNVPVRDLPGVRHHRGREIGPFIDGLRRTPPVTALLRAARWARSDRAAATIVAMTVQQKMVRPDDLLKAWDAVGYTERRQALDGIIRSVCDGAQSLGELDFAKLCREYDVPEPSRQVAQADVRGVVYLDVYWDDCDVHVEINGDQHYQGTARIDDALRSNALAIKRANVISLQVPLISLAATPGLVMEQILLARAEGLLRRAQRASA